MYAEQPLPPPVQAVSVKPRDAVEDLLSAVPPTSTTYCDEAGN
jgi:hypothetical protein